MDTDRRGTKAHSGKVRGDWLLVLGSEYCVLGSATHHRDIANLRLPSSDFRFGPYSPSVVELLHNSRPNSVSCVLSSLFYDSSSNLQSRISLPSGLCLLPASGGQALPSVQTGHSASGLRPLISVLIRLQPRSYPFKRPPYSDLR